jgi:nucleoside-diphosphate-sugar epimerase
MLFVTGGAGVVGQALAGILPRRSTLWLRHRRSVQGGEAVQGDIRQLRLGLAELDYERLSRRVGAILHCAAITNFARRVEDMVQTNVEGTARVIALARAAGNVPLYYVSTAFVREPQQPGNREERSAYRDSKRIAEELVRTSGLPWIIIRPSVIVGSSVDGSITPGFQGFHAVIGAALRGEVPLVPATTRALCDFVPQDIVARATAAILASGKFGSTYWITAGAGALPIVRIIVLLRSFAASRGRRPPQLRLIDPESIERLVRPVFLAALPKRVRTRIQWILDYSHYMSIDEPFPSSLAELLPFMGVDHLYCCCTCSSCRAESVLLRNLRHLADATAFGESAELPSGALLTA